MDGDNVEVREHRFCPNERAQSDFIRSQDLYPAFIAGLGSGKTWAGSAKLVALHCQRPEVDHLAVAPTYSNLRQITLPAICERLDEVGIPYHTRTSDVMEIHTPTLGSKFLLHSGMKAERIAGFECGGAWIDEPCRIPDFQEPKRNVWKNTIARVRDKRVPAQARIVMITGTHEGKGTWVWRDWEKRPKLGHVVFRGTTFENPDGQEYAEMLVREYGAELAEQYVQGLAVDESRPAIPYEAIEAMTDSSAKREPDWPELKRAARLYVGMDIGRTKSLTVFWICSQVGGKLITLACIEMRRATFDAQWKQLCEIMAMPNVQKLAIDATYNPSTAESACAKWGDVNDQRSGRIDPVVFTTASKFALIDGMVKIASVRGMLIPDDEEIILDFFSMKRVVKSGGRVSYEAPFTADGHADRLTGAALCVRAASLGYTEPFQWTRGETLESEGLRKF